MFISYRIGHRSHLWSLCYVGISIIEPLQMASTDFQMYIHVDLHKLLWDASGENLALSQLIMNDVIDRTMTVAYFSYIVMNMVINSHLNLNTL
jgi:hypothetical protein